MEINVKQIIEGWRNDLIPPKELKELIMRVANERLIVCQSCEFNSNLAKEQGYTSIRVDYHCTKCGCPLKKKTKCLSCSCPIEKWLAVATDEEDEEIKSKTK